MLIETVFELVELSNFLFREDIWGQARRLAAFLDNLLVFPVVYSPARCADTRYIAAK